MATVVARRGLLQAGAVTGGLALAGLRSGASVAGALPKDRLRLDGMIGGHIRLDLAHGAVIRLVELERALRPVRELGEVRMNLGELYDAGQPTAKGNPLQRVCGRAQTLAIEIAAADWSVPWYQCLLDPRGITHVASSRTVGYKTWVDIV